MPALLRDFIIANRERIIDGTRQRARERIVAKSTDVRIENGVPLFLGQLVDALTASVELGAGRAVGPARARKEITDSAAMNGRDLLRNGSTIAQVVHGYGDVCQVVTELVTAADVVVSGEEFRVFNLCLDDAIAGSVTAFARQRERQLRYEGTERLGVFAHELGNVLATAILSFDAMRKGMVGVGGSTSAVHARSLCGLQSLVERSLAEIRLEGSAPQIRRILLVEFIEQIELGAAMQADAHGLLLTVGSVDSDLAVDADWQLLASATLNLLQNAFKFSPAGSSVSLVTHATVDRVLIDVRDACGGLPPGKAAELFRPFTQASENRSGLGLGLTIAANAVRASSGELSVRDLPGEGCVFTIDLPRRAAPRRWGRTASP